MRRTEEEAQRTREDILDAALTVFSEKGYAATRLEEVAAEARVTRGAVYHHFVNKSGLYLAVIDEAERSARLTIDEAITEGGSFREILGRILSASFGLLEEDVRYRQAFALTQETRRLVPVQTRTRAQAVDMVDAIAEYMKVGIQQGDVRADADPENLARAFLAYQNGMAELWLANPKAFSMKEQAATLASLLLTGISAKD